MHGEKVQGIGCILGLDIGLWGLGFITGSGFMVQGFGAYGVGVRFQGEGCRVKGVERRM